jgi:hypothetical protein
MRPWNHETRLSRMPIAVRPLADPESKGSGRCHSGPFAGILERHEKRAVGEVGCEPLGHCHRQPCLSVPPARSA